MHALETKIPPPLVTLIFAFIMWLASSVGPSFVMNEKLSHSLIIACFVSGIGVAVMGILTFKKAGTTATPLSPEKASLLVSHGIYRFTRNPMYLGSALVLLAWAFYLSSVLVFIAIPVFILYINRFQIIPEERALQKIFGVEFDDYQTQVRRWL